MLLLMVMTFAACDQFRQGAQGASGNSPEGLRALIFEVPEVQKADDYIRSISDGQHGLTWLGSPKEQSDGFIYLDLGYNGEARFETYFRLRIKAGTGNIEAEHLTKGVWMNLEAYRAFDDGSAFHSFSD